MLEHVNLILIDIIDYIFAKAVAQMDGYAANPTERFKDFAYFPIFESFGKVEGHWFGYG